jgi:hypothetical protein
MKICPKKASEAAQDLKIRGVFRRRHRCPCLVSFVKSILSRRYTAL